MSMGNRYWILDTGYWMLDTGYWILDTGYWILDTGYWILDKWIKVLDIFTIAHSHLFFPNFNSSTITHEKNALSPLHVFNVHCL